MPKIDQAWPKVLAHLDERLAPSSRCNPSQSAESFRSKFLLASPKTPLHPGLFRQHLS